VCLARVTDDSMSRESIGRLGDQQRPHSNPSCTPSLAVASADANHSPTHQPGLFKQWA